MPTAQAILGSVGKFDQINIVSAPGADKATVQRAIARVLPRGVEVVTGQTVINEQTTAVSQALGIFNTALLVFGFIALFVGGFTILNTFSITVGQRTRELALLRIVGASRRQVFRSVLGEAVIVGLVASLIGLGLGVLAAIGLEKLLSAFGVTLPSGPLAFQARTVIVCLIVGVGVTFVAAISPARRAVRIAPVAAVSEQQTEQEVPMRRRFTQGGVIAAIGIVLLAVGLTKPAIQLVGLGAVLIFVGVAMLAPAVARPMASVIGRPLARLLGTSGRLGRENSMRSPRRTAQTAAALMVGLALVSAIAVFGASLSSSATSSVDNAISADIIISAASNDRERGVRQHRANRGVRGPRRHRHLGRLQRPVRVPSLPHESPGPRDQEPGRDGDPRHDVGDLEGTGRRPAARRHHNGQQRPSVGGRHRPGAVRADGSLHHAHRGDLPAERAGREVPRRRRLLPAALPEPAPGGGVAQDGRQARRAAGGREGAGAYPNVQVQSRAQFEASQKAAVNKLLGLVYALLALAVIIALIGIVNTLMLSVFERTHEIGLLRAVGMKRRQIRAMIRSESVILAVFGAIIGIIVGTGLGIALVSSLRSQGFTSTVVPVSNLVIFLILAALLGLLAASWPARRAAKLDVLAAIAAD